MDEGVRAKYNNRYQSIQKRRVIWLVTGCVGFILIFIMFRTPIASTIISRMRGIWIEMNRSMVTYDSQLPEIKNMDLSIKNVNTDLENQYEYITKARKDLYQGNLILVNSKYACLLMEKNKLSKVEKYKNKAYKIMDSNMQLNHETLMAFNDMMESFSKATGKKDMIITSAYRSLKEQADALQEKVDLFGEEDALKWAMVPGYSEHHSGYAMDLSIYTDEGEYVNYRGQDEYSWIDLNCYQYGFIRRYANEKKDITKVVDEQWHYRYVGVPHAYIMTDKNYCLEEYVDYLRNFAFNKQHLKVKCEAGVYEIYFVPSEGKETNVPVPRNHEYTISGNNVDGFIITVTLEDAL